jgi:ADP-ribosylglycohydrolase
MLAIHDRAKLGRYAGCLLGGAVGDALGAPIEFMRIDEIRHRFGENGLTDYAEAYGRKGAITDDTQMTLFTAEGMLRAFCRGNLRGICHPPSVVHHAYIRWLITQGEKSASHWDQKKTGWLIQVPELYSRRAPGNSCLSALRSGRMGTMKESINDSKGCGGVMRIAPIGLMYQDPGQAFDMGCEVAAITHGHPTGYLAAGTLAAIISMIMSGSSLRDSVLQSLGILRTKRNHEESLQASESALDMVQKAGQPSPEKVESLGAGWIAEEALGIALYCSLVSEHDFARAVLLSVNHSGDSDSTGAITGNLLGALLGEEAIPKNWLTDLEMREIIEELASDLLLKFKDDEAWWEKYPGW